MSSNSLIKMPSKRIPYEKGITLKQAREDSRAALADLAAKLTGDPHESLRYVYPPNSDSYPHMDSVEALAEPCSIESRVYWQDELTMTFANYPLIADAETVGLTNHGFPDPNNGPYFKSRGIASCSSASEDIDYSEDPKNEYLNEQNLGAQQAPSQSLVDDYGVKQNPLFEYAPEQYLGAQYAADCRILAAENGPMSVVMLAGQATVESSINNDNRGQTLLAGTHPVNYGPAYKKYSSPYSGLTQEYPNIDPQLKIGFVHPLPNHSCDQPKPVKLSIRPNSNDGPDKLGWSKGYVRGPGLSGTQPANYRPGLAGTHPANYCPGQMNHTSASDPRQNTNTFDNSRIPTPNYGGEGYFPDPQQNVNTSHRGASNCTNTNSNGHSDTTANPKTFTIPARFAPFVLPPSQHLVRVSGATGYPHGKTSRVGDLVPGNLVKSSGIGSYTDFSSVMDRSEMSNHSAYGVTPNQVYAQSSQYGHPSGGHESIAQDGFTDTRSPNMNDLGDDSSRSDTKPKKKRNRKPILTGYNKFKLMRVNPQDDDAKGDTGPHRCTLFSKKTPKKGPQTGENSEDADYNEDSSLALPVSHYREYMNGDRKLNGVLAEPELMSKPCSRCAENGLTCKVLRRAGDKGEVFTEMRPRWITQQVANYIVCANCWRISKGSICNFWYRPADKQERQKRTIRNKD